MPSPLGFEFLGYAARTRQPRHVHEPHAVTLVLGGKGSKAYENGKRWANA